MSSSEGSFINQMNWSLFGLTIKTSNTEYNIVYAIICERSKTEANVRHLVVLY